MAPKCGESCLAGYLIFSHYIHSLPSLWEWERYLLIRTATGIGLYLPAVLGVGIGTIPSVTLSRHGSPSNWTNPIWTGTKSYNPSRRSILPSTVLIQNDDRSKLDILACPCSQIIPYIIQYSGKLYPWSCTNWHVRRLWSIKYINVSVQPNYTVYYMILYTLEVMIISISFLWYHIFYSSMIACPCGYSAHTLYSCRISWWGQYQRYFRRPYYDTDQEKGVNGWRGYKSRHGQLPSWPS
jgi:hypothetical protein